MPIISDAEFPIKEAPLSGPAIDAWNGRKEENNNEQFSSDKLKENYERIKDNLFAELRNLVQQ